MRKKSNPFDVTEEAISGVLQKVSAIPKLIQGKKAFLGFDGYIDYLYSAVQARKNQSDWAKFSSMKDFGELLRKVAGSSAGVEIVPKRLTSGGFVGNTAKALNALGIPLHLIASLGDPQIEIPFEPLVQNVLNDIVSLGNPGKTVGLEFDDGKLMLTDFSNIYHISWKLLVDKIGINQLIRVANDSDVIGLAYWSSIPELSDIWKHFLIDIFPSLKNLNQKFFFVDLADIKKSDKAQILEMLKILKEIDRSIPVVLSLNDQEAKDISTAFNKFRAESIEDYLLARKLNDLIDVSYLIVHTPHFAAISTKDRLSWVAQAYTSHAKFTTSAGDHFNGGLILGLLCGLSPVEILLLGNAISSCFIRTGKSSLLDDLQKFVRNYDHYLEIDDPTF